MVQSTKAIVGPAINKSRILYAVGIGANLLISLAHIAYTFVTYETLNESALWFFSGALAMVFNAGLNILCLAKYNKLSYTITMIANVIMFIFSIVLAIEIPEFQVICFAVAVLYNGIACYNHNLRMNPKQN